MSAELLVTPEVTGSRGAASRRDDGLLDVPALDRETGRLGRSLSSLTSDRHPVWTYVVGVLLSVASIACLSILAGLLVTRVLLHVPGVASDDEWLVAFLARHRSTGLTEASLVGSIMAGGVVLPIIAACAALVAVLARHWRLAAFLGCALAVESGSYRATTLVIHRHRPAVRRLESLPVNASYPSGHTAAAIAVYCGLAFLLTSRLANKRARIAVWTIAVLIPIYVGFSRMYRGMHHPIDVLGGVIIGIASLSALVLVARASARAAG
jgi:membrane-associated phospholipid phosphatase